MPQGVDARTGAVLARITVPADPDGYEALTTLVAEQSGLRAWALESTGSYGAGLTRHLATLPSGYAVYLDVEQLLEGGQMGMAAGSYSVNVTVVDPHGPTSGFPWATGNYSVYPVPSGGDDADATGHAIRARAAPLTSVTVSTASSPNHSSGMEPTMLARAERSNRGRKRSSASLRSPATCNST